MSATAQTQLTTMPLPSFPKHQSRIVLLRRPAAGINTSLSGDGTFGLEKDVPVLSGSKVGDEDVVVAVEYLSLDPAMRGWLNDARSYIAPVQIGAVMRAAGVGRIIATGSKVGALKVGDWVYGTVGWQEFATIKEKDCTKIQVDAKTSPSMYLGVLGMSGQTAYWGLLDVAKIKKGETVVVSGAAGSVGIIACQIAKLKGCKVIAIAGGAAKCKFLKEEIGCDAVLDYKSTDFKRDFRDTVGYLDVFFDNVGGDILDLALTRLKPGARIALCGAISAYNTMGNASGLKNYLNLISQRASITGFIVFDYTSRFATSEADLKSWLAEGTLTVRETTLTGLDQCAAGLVGLFEGVNTGKLLVKVGAASGAIKL